MKNQWFAKKAVLFAGIFLIANMVLGPLQTVHADYIDNSAALSNITEAVNQNGAVGDQEQHSCESDWIPSFYCMAEGLFSSLMWLSGLVLGWAGLLFDFVMRYTVIQNPIDLMYSGIVVGWTVIRDFANLAFIFILIYIGIATMLDLRGINTRQTLAMVVMVALFINFSFFLTRLAIDISNIVAYQVYSGIAPNKDEGIATSIRKAMYVEANYQKQDIAKVVGNGAGYKFLTVMSAIAVMNFIAAWVLFSASLLFISRLVVFVFLIVLSPAAFICYILPNTRSNFNKWKEYLVSQALVAPIFLFFVLVIVTILRSGLQIQRGVSASVANVDKSSGVLFIFILSSMMFLFALRTTRKYAGDAGKMMTGWGSSILGFAAGGALGIAGFAGRQTVGRAALRVADSETLRNREAAGGIGGFLAKRTQIAATGVSKSTFDARNTSTVGKYSGKLGVPLGKGSKSNYSKLRSDNQKAYEARLKEVAKTRVLGEDFYESAQDAFRAPHIAERSRLQTEHIALKAERTTLQGERESLKGRLSAATDAATKEDLQRQIQAKNKEIESKNSAIDSKLGKIKEKDTQITKMRDSQFVANEIATARGKERAKIAATRMSDIGTPGQSGVQARTLQLLGLSRPQFAAAQAYRKSQGKDKKTRILDELKEEMKGDEDGSAAGGGH